MFLALFAAAALSQGPAEAPVFLAAAVDEPTPEARRKAADTLAGLERISLEDWLAAARDFAPWNRPPEAGVHREQVELWDGKTTVAGEVILQVPQSYDPDIPQPILLAMHGTGGTGDSMLGLWSELAERHGLLLLCPSDPGSNVGFAATDEERLLTLAALRWARRRCNVDEGAVFLTGFSRGGHMTWDLALRYPDHWAAIAPMVGGPRFEIARGAANFRYFENLRGLPIACLQGARDQAGLVWSVNELFARFDAADFELAELHLFPELGHNVDMTAVEWSAFFQARRPARPQHLVRTYAREGQGRHAWVEVLAASPKVAEVFTPQIRQSQARRMDDDDLRRLLIDAAIEKTGRLEAKRDSSGAIQLRSKGLSEVRLLLSQDMLPPAGKKLRVKLGSTQRRLAVEPSKSLLLHEFVERFDRTFLPVAEARLKVGR